MKKYTLVKTVSGVKPLLCYKDQVLVSKGSKLYLCSHQFDNFKFVSKLPNKKLASFHRIFDRILRGGIRVACQLNDETVLALIGDRIWRISLYTGEISLDLEINDKRKVLNFTRCVGISGFDDCVCFGEYFDNPDMNEVSIWTRPLTDQGEWKKVYTFEKNTINHIHNLIPAPEMNAVWILAGDFEHAASMWLSENNFRDVRKVCSGNQIYRAVWLDRHGKDKYYYATDSQTRHNVLNELKINGDSVEISPVSDIEGSSIYYGKGSAITAFSTAVEPGIPTGKLIKDLFEVKPGSGIRSKNACIYVLDKDGVTEIFRAKKDAIPARLGQFGAFMFPFGEMPERRIYAYGVGVKKYDNKCLIFEQTE